MTENRIELKYRYFPLSSSIRLQEKEAIKRVTWFWIPPQNNDMYLMNDIITVCIAMVTPPLFPHTQLTVY